MGSMTRNTITFQTAPLNRSVKWLQSVAGCGLFVPRSAFGSIPFKTLRALLRGRGCAVSSAMPPDHIAAAVRRILAEADFYCGIRAGHRQHPSAVSVEQVTAARAELKATITRELQRGPLAQDEAGSGARSLSKWLSGRV
jgi:hypothetical protein